MHDKGRLVVGLMSGTSVDGIDAAVVRIYEEDSGTQVTLKHLSSTPFPKAVKEEIFRMFEPDYATMRSLGALNTLLGELYAKAALSAISAAGLDPCDIFCIASHGQTLWHEPNGEEYLGQTIRYTMQLGDGAVIATHTGVPCVSDFRPHDMALCGQGAPLVPFTEYLLYKSDTHSRLLLNLGGIANVTAIPRSASPENIRAFDTGPANMLIDAAVAALFGETMDRDGRFAQQGKVNEPLLNWLLSEPYYALPPPKSTGRELFGAFRLEAVLKQAQGLSPYDIIATLTELTARTVWEAYDCFLRPTMPAEQLIVAGGGSCNPSLMAALAAHFSKAGVSVLKAEELGICSQAKEAVAFAILGDCAMRRVQNNLPKVTGATRATVMGKISYP